MPSDEHATNGHHRDPKTGQFTAGNTAAMVHGGRSEALRRQLEEEAAEALADRREGIQGDLGGPDRLSTIALDTVDRYVTASALLEWMERRLLAEGVLTGKGRRKAIHNAYLQQLDRVLRLGQQLGLERRRRHVNPHEAVRIAVEEANRETAET